MSRWRFTKYVLPVVLSFSLISSGFALPALASLAKGSVQEVQTSPPSSSSNSISNPQTIATSETNSDAYFLNLISGKEPATDSASAATAMSTGFKTDDGNIAWLPGDPIGGSLTTIAETLRTQKGFAIGVASTVQFSHATPAAFVSHNVNRNNYADIANEIIGTVSPEVVIGGGHPDFNGGDYRFVGGATTWNNLLTGATPYNHIVARASGMDGGTALLNEAALVDLSLGDKLIGVFGGMGSNFEYHQASDTPGAPSITRGSIENPTLADVTNATLDILSQDPDGFFVMFEQGDIDWSNHANDFENMIGGVWDLDQAVQAAEEFVDDSPALDWNNTLVIVTSDHSNSYMRLPYPLGMGDLPKQIVGGGDGVYGGSFLYPDGDVSYRTGNHTNELVTLWARGKSAYLFAQAAGSWYSGTQIIDNSQVYSIMLDAVETAGAKNVIMFIGDGMNIEHEIAGSRYLYGEDYGLAWHDWGKLSNGWAGYAATWDVTTYNKFASLVSAPAYVTPVDPASLGSNLAAMGYDPAAGGLAPFPIGADNNFITDGRDEYFLTLLGAGSGKEPATDSASAATAISTGFKTDDGNLAWLPGDPVGGSLTTIAETLRDDDGFAIGVASTVQYSHATPAAFVSHNVNRNNYATIANEIIKAVSPEVVIGGGHPDFNGGDYRYVGGETTWNSLIAGTIVTYTHVVTRLAGVDGGPALLSAASTVNLAVGDKLIGVFGGMGSNFDYHEVSDTPGAPSITYGSTENPTLSQVTEATLNVLSQDPDGFFALFEQGDIDWSNHANNFENMIGGVLDLDIAVQAAEAFIAQPGGPEWTDTLVIVTSDHSNSYMRIRQPLGAGDLPAQIGMDYAWDYPDNEVTYRTTNHTNELVTLWARGQGASLLNDYVGSWYAGTLIVDNSQLYQVMLRAAHEAGVKHIVLFIGDGMNIEHEIAASRYWTGDNFNLTWHNWGLLSDGWAGYASTWDVTTYNAYAALQGAPVYSSPVDPSTLGANLAVVGYNPAIGGSAPYPLQADPLPSDSAGRDGYYLNLLGGKEPATDSASAATAMSTGFKTDDGNVAWLPGDPIGGSLTTIAETLQLENGFAIGLASTVQFSHATPAAFASHNVNRNNYADIANEIITQMVPEVVIGGGNPYYNGGDYRYVGGATTWSNLLSYNTDYTHVVVRQNGVDGGIALTNAAAGVDLVSGDRLIGVFGGMGNNFEFHQASDTPGAPSITRGSIENPTLADVTNATLDILSQDPDGFFVMFEQGDIDWSNHANDFENMIGGVWDLDQAVQAAEEFIAQPGGPEWNDTLVIVTSDHSNSYMRNRAWLGAGDLPEQYAGSIPGGYGTTFVYPDGEVNYRSTNHTNELVTLWARGRSAELFSEYASGWYADDQIIDNTQIYHAMLRAAQEQGVAHILLFIGDGMNIEHEIAGSRYLYGTDQGLTWHDWRNLVDGWGGYVATWDVTTYNKYAASLAQPAYDLSTFDPLVGYDPLKGGSAPYPLQPAYADLVSEPYLYVEMDSNTAITETLTITKTGSANVAWSLVESPAQDWVSVAPDSGFMAFDGNADLSVVLDASGLAPGFYQSHLLVQNPYADLDIPLVLKVRAGGSASTPANDLPVKLLGSYSTGLEGGSEIVTYDPDTFTLYVTNGVSQTVDVLSIADIANSHTPTLVDSIDLSAYGAGITSVDVHNGLLAAAVPSAPKTDNGVVVLLQDSQVISVTVGALPDMVTFTPDGSHLLVANEGEPSEDYTVDPPGTVSIIDVSGGISAINQTDVTTLGFGAYEAVSLDPRIRIFGPNANVSQDLEPEYIAVSADSTTAWVTLQENNALAVIDLTAKQITEVRALGFKDWSGSAGMDASDRDGSTLITNWQVWGLYQPDGIAAYTVNGSTYLVTANEGDSRDYAAYSEEDRIGSATLDPTAFPHAGLLQQDANLGRLKLSVAGNNLNPTYTADPDQDGDVDRLYVYGGRSFSIWDGATGELVFDSGDLLEQITLAQTPSLFNADSGDPAKIDTRSDDKGPEPESVVVAEVDGRMLAFITLERSAGGVMIFEVTHPQAPVFVRYLPSAPGDISPEGLAFVSADDSPTGDPLLVMAHEISGSTTVYELASEYSLYMPLIGR